MRIKITVILAILLAFSVFQASPPVYAQLKVGTTAASFLGIAVGPRATAMGGAFVAVSSDVSSLYWNPGALARNFTNQVMVSHTRWFVETDFNWVGTCIQVGENAFGFSITQLDYGEEYVTTIENPEGTGEKWGASDLSIAGTFSRNMTDRFSVGGSVKYISQKVWHESAGSFAFDVGLLFITQFNDLKIGMTISNFGTDMQLDGKDLLNRIDIDPDNSGHNETIVAKLKTDKWPLPLFFRVGVAMDMYNRNNVKVTLAADAFRPSDNSEIVNLGTEVSWFDMLYLRGGYKSLFREDSEEGLTAGAGLKYAMSGTSKISLDYAYGDFGLLNEIHIFSIGLNF